MTEHATQGETFDVAIVGYGPVGAATALQLAAAGLRVAIVDRTHEIMDIPRAVGLDGEAVRGFQRLGLAEEVVATLQPRREKDEVCFCNSQRQPLFGMDVPARASMGWRLIAFFDQPELEAVLREQVAQRDAIQVLLGWELRRLEERHDEVVLTCAEGEAERALRARYVVGCDGASSSVRRLIGAKWESLGYDHDWLVVDVVIREGTELPITTMQVCDPVRLTTYIPGRDPYRRWEFQLIEGETREEMLQDEKIRALIEPWVPASDYTVRRAAVYQFHAATASDWRRGRVLLAGDAAHQTPPFLGQGLNSGFRDAVCLGWKLPLVLSGACDDSLLDSYQAERGPHAHDLVDRAVGVGQLMETLAAREAGLPDPHEGTEARAAPADGELVPPLRAGTLHAPQIGPASPVGRAFFQPDVRADGRVCRFDELLGTGFAIVGRSPKDVVLGDGARAVWERLGGRTLAIDSLDVEVGKFDPLFDDHAAAVLRPDRFVFGVVDDQNDLDSLVGDLARRLALRDGPGS